MDKNHIPHDVLEPSPEDKYFFPVGLHDLYFDMDKERAKQRWYPSPKQPHIAVGFNAVIDEDRGIMFSCVSNSYTLITNKWAYNLGLRVASIIFGVQDSEISFWRGEFYDDRASCYMDIRIDKTLRIAQVEHSWIAIVRMNNSYDKSCSLSYEVGFYLETMDNRDIPLGLLIPSLSLQFSASHIWKLETIEKKIMSSVYSNYKARNLFFTFEMMVKDLLSIEVVDDEILPLFCQLAKIKKLDNESEEDIEFAHNVINIERDSEFWIQKCGPNAYAALCAYADFASKYARRVPFLEKPNEFQSQLGKFVDDLIESKQKEGKDFSLVNFITKEALEVKKQIKLMCLKN